METVSLRMQGEQEELMKDEYSCTNGSSRYQRHEQLKMELDDNEDVELERLLSRPIHRLKLPLCEAPEFVKRLSSYEEVDVGDTVTFWVQYRAFPSATVKWFKDEEEVRETKRHQLDSSSEDNGIVRLIVHDVRAHDEGAYKCKVENQEGVASTTGYLSVAGKPTRNNRLQKAKMVSDRTVSTPPFLRPIAEQKSMEEREEAEYSRLPPSPLQAFIDNIRRSAKSGPVYYGTDDYCYEDYESNDDFDDNVFGEENNTDEPTSDQPSPYESTAEEDTDQEDTSTPETAKHSAVCLRAVDSFISPLVDWNTSTEDSAYGSDTTIGCSPSEEETRALDTEDGVEEVTMLRNECQTSKTGLRERRNRLHLQRSEAIEVPDNVQPTSELHLTIRDNQNPDLETFYEILRDSQTSHAKEEQPSDSQDFSSVDLPPNSASFPPEPRLLDILDFPCVQFFLVLATCFTVAAPASQIPLLFLLAILFLVSLLAFGVLLHRADSSTR